MEWTCVSDLTFDGHLGCYFEDNANNSISLVTYVLVGSPSEIETDQWRIKDDVSCVPYNYNLVHMHYMEHVRTCYVCVYLHGSVLHKYNIRIIYIYIYNIIISIYRRLRLISAFAYHSRWQGNMRLIKNAPLLYEL